VTTAPDKVWEILSDVQRYQEWWPQHLRIQLISSGNALIGSQLRITPAAGKPFLCRVVAAEKPTRIELRYEGGFVDGKGEWVLERVGNETQVTYRMEAHVFGWVSAVISKFVNLGSIHSKYMRSLLENLRETSISRR
jgi:carbon monoxide dehydrogenase subunit G